MSRRISLLIAACFAAGASAASPAPDSWVGFSQAQYLSNDWGCTGSSTGDATRIVLHADNTFEDDTGATGTWISSGRSVAFTYGAGTLYIGKTNRSHMSDASGTMVNSSTGQKGCWTIFTPV